MEFKIYRFDDVATLINGRAYLMPELQDSGKYRIVRVGNFSGKDEWFYSDMELEEDKYCESGDLLYKWACNFGPEIWKEEKVIYHYHIWKVLQDSKKVDKIFLFYYLQYVTPMWLGGTNGTTMVHITKASMEKKKIYIPALVDNQEKIAKVLSNYDQLIENNNKRIKLLNDMTESLYKEWFVRFRFPGYENTEFENGVPKGWKYNSIFKQANITYGYAFKSELFTDDETLNPVVRIRDIPANQTKTFTQEDCDEKYLINADEILVGMDGIFHMCLWNGEKAYLNQRVVKLSSKDSDMCNLFLYLSIKEQIKFWESTICGTTVAHLGDKHLKRIYVLMPDKKIMKMANAIFENIMRESRMLIQENRRLIKQRDLLLPRLMSGKLSVEGKEVI